MIEPPPKKSARPTVAAEDGPRGGKSPDHQPEVILTQSPLGGKRGPILSLSSSASTAKDEATYYTCVRLFPRRVIRTTVEETFAAVIAGHHPDPLHPDFPEVWIPGAFYDDRKWLDDNPGVVNVIDTLCRYWRDTEKFEDLAKWLGGFRCGLPNRNLKVVLQALVERGWLTLHDGKLGFPAEHCPVLKFKQLLEVHQNESAK